MAKSINQLTNTKIAKLAPGRHHDGLGLYLTVAEKGGKSWSLIYMTGGKSRQMGLGPYPTINLEEARERARKAKQKVLDGLDPIAERTKVRSLAKAEVAKAMNFKEASERYISAHSAGWKNVKHGAQWTATLETYAFPFIGKLDVAHVETSHVLQILEPIWATKAETASRVRGRVESILDWAKARHLRSGENPARWKGHLDAILPPKAKVTKVEHHEAMEPDDMPAFITRLRSMDSISARALEFTILTASRTGETIGAKDSEIRDGVWIIPAERMKAGREHRIPLCARALEILKATPREAGNPYLFTGGRSGKGLSNMAMLNLIKGMAGCEELTVHGFRSTFRDWAGDRTSFPREVIEAALAHGIKDKAEAAYRRSDALEKRARLMEAWATFIGTAKPAQGNVRAIRSA